jgi:hypothetical protein
MATYRAAPYREFQCRVQRLFEAGTDSSECLVSVELLTEIQPNEVYSIASRNSFQFYGLVTSVPRCFGCPPRLRSEDLRVAERIVHGNAQAAEMSDVPGRDGQVLRLGDRENQ